MLLRPQYVFIECTEHGDKFYFAQFVILIKCFQVSLTVIVIRESQQIKINLSLDRNYGKTL
jgi:hypothetical protein